MIIKNHSNKNQYFLTSTGLWVRNFVNGLYYEDINKLTTQSDYDLILKNEMKNATLNIPSIDTENYFYPNITIVSDGFKFEEKQHLLKGINAIIIGTNRSLNKWKDWKMDWYVTNNPYPSCMTYLPTNHNYHPKCIVSTRTNPDFISKYRSRLGVIYRYSPVKDKKFSSNYFAKPLYYVDDYRNPICASISLAYKWGVQKLLLFCCDDVFDTERPGSKKEGNFWMYPQHNIAKGLIEGNLYWMNSSEYLKVKIANHSSVEYKNASYIKEEDIKDFFK